jgi:hypothetical protein
MGCQISAFIGCYYRAKLAERGRITQLCELFTGWSTAHARNQTSSCGLARRDLRREMICAMGRRSVMWIAWPDGGMAP